MEPFAPSEPVEEGGLALPMLPVAQAAQFGMSVSERPAEPLTPPTTATASTAASTLAVGALPPGWVPPVTAPTAELLSGQAESEEDAAMGSAVVQTVQLSVYPFSAFSVLTKFIEALSNLPDVRDVRARRFHKGRLDVTID